MALRIAVFYTVPDARATVAAKKFQELGLSGTVRTVTLADCYTVDAKLAKKETQRAAKALTNSLLEEYRIGSLSLPGKWSWLIEIGFLPGVTDNVGATAKETIEDLLKRKFSSGEAVYTSRIFFIDGTLSKADAECVASSLHNPLIERARIFSAADYKKRRGLPLIIPRVSLKSEATVTIVNLDIPDDELIRIGKHGICGEDGVPRGPLALDLEYMRTIRDYFKEKKRSPTDVELESIAQTWSEHCKHTIFADPIDEVKDGLYKHYICAATKRIRKSRGKNDFCASVFIDNSGAIVFDDTYLISHKVETHNSPSALDPFGGSVTGIVGVNRDAIGFGLGAKPVANVYGFCLADPNDTRMLYRDIERTQALFPPRRIMQGVVQGVNVGGNCSGIPTAQGFVYFNDRYRGKPLVFVGTVGLLPRKIHGRKTTVKKAEPGDYVVMVGGRVGQDGIHGATFSSEALSIGSPATAVQIGDPITQKKMSDALVKEARDAGLYHSITDNGAGGLSCSVAEMAKESGGCRVELSDVPLKYPGLAPWKIWVSESQERMTLAVPKQKWPAFKKLMARRGVEATIIGEFTDSGRCIIRYRGKPVMDIDLEFLHNGLPRRHLTTKKTVVRQTPLPMYASRDLSKTLAAMLSRLNIASYEFIAKQYDHEVQASSVLKPLQGRGRVNADAAVLRPVLGSKKGIVLSAALHPTYSELDSYRMAAATIDSAIRAAVAAGANIEKLAILDNFCWCSSNDPERLGQLKDAVRACYDYAVVYGTPFISGKDSMFNDFKGFDEKGNAIAVAVPPTLLISALGVVDDTANAVSLDFKFKGDLVYVLGETTDELAGSEYAAYISETEKKEYTGTNVPTVDAKKNKKLYKAFHTCSRRGLVASAISIGRGGIATALAKSAIGGKLGADVSLHGLAKTIADDRGMFSESQGRLLVSIAPEHKQAFEKALASNFLCIGRVTGDSRVAISGRRGRIVDLALPVAERAYRLPFSAY